MAAHQAPLSLGFSKQEYWSGLPFPSPGDPNPGIEPRSPALQVDSLPTEPPGSPNTQHSCQLERLNPDPTDLFSLHLSSLFLFCFKPLDLEVVVFAAIASSSPIVSLNPFLQLVSTFWCYSQFSLKSRQKNPNLQTK